MSKVTSLFGGSTRGNIPPVTSINSNTVVNKSKDEPGKNPPKKDKKSEGSEYYTHYSLAFIIQELYSSLELIQETELTEVETINKAIVTVFKAVNMRKNFPRDIYKARVKRLLKGSSAFDLIIEQSYKNYTMKLLKVRKENAPDRYDIKSRQSSHIVSALFDLHPSLVEDEVRVFHQDFYKYSKTTKCYSLFKFSHENIISIVGSVALERVFSISMAIYSKLEAEGKLYKKTDDLIFCNDNAYRWDFISSKLDKVNYNKDIMTMEIPDNRGLISDDEYETLFNKSIFKKWLDVTFDEQESKDLLGEIAGYLLTGRNAWHKYFVLFGEARSGKTTIPKTLRKILGYKNTIMGGPDLLTSRFGPYSLAGKAFIFLDDISLKRQTQEAFASKLQTLTGGGGEGFRCEDKGKPMVDVDILGNFVMTANKLPSSLASADVNASSARSVLLRFMKTRLEEGIEHEGNRYLGPTFDKKLEEELHIVFNWAIRHLISLSSNNYKFTTTEEGEEAVEHTKRDSDPVYDFIKECLNIEEVDGLSGIPYTKLHEKYTEIKGTRKKMDLPHFKRSLNSRLKGMNLDSSRWRDRSRNSIRVNYIEENSLGFTSGKQESFGVLGVSFK